jgi:multidrug transporter EmrE-like cation transporter
MNAAGFTVLAIAQVFPGGLADRFRLLPRLALIGFSATTIVGWAMFGARYDMGYLATGIEVAIVALTSILVYRESGSPMAIARRGLAFASR